MTVPQAVTVRWATLALGLTACSTDPCGAYADDPLLARRCHVVQAQAAPDIASARCELAGPDQEECRVSWIEAHLDLPIETLLAACTTPECRFVALDYRPSPLPKQVELCDALGGLAENCVVHGLVRYFGGRPTVEQQRADTPSLGRWSRSAALEAGLAAQCGIEVDCDTFGADAEACRGSATNRPVVDCGVYRPDFPRPPS